MSSDRDEIRAAGKTAGEDRSDAEHGPGYEHEPEHTGEFTIDYTPPAWYTQSAPAAAPSVAPAPPVAPVTPATPVAPVAPVAPVSSAPGGDEAWAATPPAPAPAEAPAPAWTPPPAPQASLPPLPPNFPPAAQ
ncbi:SCO5717 family growth-regulating ATPase, partial [Streptomyces sp. UNOB3_S3]|uniref:SCO5717 family growth-regulating ATPase n=1 Tax=Streptomyces sp. UNOB3_S3 TaxID=2871682 RepID=UPI0027E3AB1E